MLLLLLESWYKLTIDNIRILSYILGIRYINIIYYYQVLTNHYTFIQNISISVFPITTNIYATLPPHKYVKRNTHIIIILYVPCLKCLNIT